MRIEALTLYTRSAADQRRFFVDVFGFTPQNSSDTTLTLRVGDSLLQFEQQDDWRSFYHYAFLIPQNQFEAARAWLAGRVPLLRDAQGQEVFFFEGWNAHAVYFADADGNIGELIARHDHPVSGAGAFSVESLVNVNEIGRVVEDVDAEVKRLQQEAGLLPFGSYRPAATSLPSATAMGCSSWSRKGDRGSRCGGRQRGGCFRQSSRLRAAGCAFLPNRANLKPVCGVIFVYAA